MRLISFAAAISLAIVPVAALAQQSPPTTGDTIGHPPPLSGPPPLAEPSAAQTAPSNAKPAASQPAPKGYTGAYAPTNTATPYSSGPLLQSSAGPGLNVTNSDGVLHADGQGSSVQRLGARDGWVYDLCGDSRSAGA